MVEVSLSSDEIMSGALTGIMRQIENVAKNRKDFHGATEEVGWQIHIEGALGELALAKYLGTYYAGKGRLRDSDVGDVDVRTAAKDSHRLILHPDDPDDRKFFLLTGANGSYKIWGWIYGRDGKKSEYWQDPAGGRPAYFIPKNHLTAVN